VAAIGYDGRGDFQMDREGRLTRRVERTVAPFAFCGAAIYHPRLFQGAEPGVWSMNRLFDKAMEAGRLHGVRMGGLWLHVGTPAAIGEAERAIKASIA
jgi:MurNAc alpha-1-phosphate uridylyltransferase